MTTRETTDYDFRHHLFDTLILLGADKRIAALLKKSADKLVTEDDVDELRNYNIELINRLKFQLVDVNSMDVTPSKPRK